MNIILFQPSEVQLPLLRSDLRGQHLLKVLRCGPGDSFDCGLVNGPRGRGTVLTLDRETITLSFVWSAPPPALCPLHLLVGLPRPQTARDILREGTSLGVAALHFVRTERGEASYARSSLWQSDEWRSPVLQGTAQAFCTRLPEVTHGQGLGETIGLLPENALRLALDNYEATQALAGWHPSSPTAVILAIGAERGWSAGERTWLRDHGFILAHLGTRVLRTETACIAAITLIKARCGWL